jgi:hypothetical protein
MTTFSQAMQQVHIADAQFAVTFAGVKDPVVVTAKNGFQAMAIARGKSKIAIGVKASFIEVGAKK